MCLIIIQWNFGLVLVKYSMYITYLITDNFPKDFQGQGNDKMVSVSGLSRGSSRFESGAIRLFQKGGILSECYLLVSTSAMIGSPKVVHIL